MTFAEIPIGARFKFQGDTYTKIAISVAREDTTRAAHIFPRRESQRCEADQAETVARRALRRRIYERKPVQD